jgi:hypothetical protein
MIKMIVFKHRRSWNGFLSGPTKVSSIQHRGDKGKLKKYLSFAEDIASVNSFE